MDRGVTGQVLRVAENAWGNISIYYAVSCLFSASYHMKRTWNTELQVDVSTALRLLGLVQRWEGKRPLNNISVQVRDGTSPEKASCHPAVPTTW